MTKLDVYEGLYENVAMTRADGILEARLHTNNSQFVWSGTAHRELSHAFETIASDDETRVVILTGTGSVFCTEIARGSWGPLDSPAQRDRVYSEGQRLLRSLLEIPVPVISAINGPAHQHAELVAAADIVLASRSVTLREPHFSHGRVPGDGVHIVWPLLLGLNRARYFQLTGRVMDVEEAHQLGIVAEILDEDALLPRAWELARQLAVASTLQLRYTRVVMNLQLQAALQPALGYGLVLENMAALDDTLSGKAGPTDVVPT